MEVIAKLCNTLLSGLLSLLGVFLPTTGTQTTVDLSSLPAYEDMPYVVLEENQPNFTQEELARLGEEEYSALDDLGRCGSAFAVIGLETMPTEERGSIGQVKPSGWHSVKYDCVDGKYLYNRCHLIGYQLSGENANEKNLITGTRYLNVEGMLPFENDVAEYVQETNNHVAYRVTPVFEEDNLLASGVQMEAWSVEDGGTGLCFNVYVYNVQPGVELDYATGESREADIDWMNPDDDSAGDEESMTYLVNLSSKKFHLPTCSGAAKIDEKNREEISGTKSDLISMGYTPCGQCLKG